MLRALKVLIVVAMWGSMFISPASGAVTGEVISAINATRGRTVVFSALDGGQRRELAEGCGGDLSNSVSPGGARYYAFAKDDASGRGSLHVVDEDCASQVVLLSAPHLDVGPWTAWSPSGRRIAFHAKETDLLGRPVAEGLFVGVVQRDLTGRPQSVVGVRLAFQMRPAAVSWSGDEQRVTFNQELPSSLYVGGAAGDIFLGNVDTGAVLNLTNSEVGEYHPVFSPTEDRIAYVTRTSKAGCYRNDIFVRRPSGAATQLTNKNNTSACQILHPSYSPDGKQIAFSGWPNSGGANIYRLAVEGTGRAVDLTSSSSDIHYVPKWRT